MFLVHVPHSIDFSIRVLYDVFVFGVRLPFQNPCFSISKMLIDYQKIAYQFVSLLHSEISYSAVSERSSEYHVEWAMLKETVYTSNFVNMHFWASPSVTRLHGPFLNARF